MRLPVRLSLAAVGALLAFPLPAGAACSEASCGVVSMPHSLNFSGDRGGLNDRREVGTGFTMVDAPSRGHGYRPDLLNVDSGALTIDTTAGIAYRQENSLDNALGVGVKPRGSAFSLRTTLTGIPAVPTGYAQAGLWFGSSDDDYVKLVVIATSSGTRVQMLRESAGVPRGYYDPVAIDTASAIVSLRLRVDPASGRATGAYALNGARPRQITTTSIPHALLYRGVDRGEAVATGGVYATHRNAAGPLRYTFQDFTAACVTSPCTAGPAPQDPDFGDTEPPVGRGGDEPAPGSPGGGGPADGGHRLGGAPASPRATLKLPRRIHVAALRRPGLRGLVRCSQRCSFSARLGVGGRTARRLGARTGLATIARGNGSATADRAGRLVLRPTHRVRRILAAARAHRLRVKLRVRVAHGAGSRQTIVRSIFVRR